MLDKEENLEVVLTRLHFISFRTECVKARRFQLYQMTVVPIMLGLFAGGMVFDAHICPTESVQVRLYIERDSGFFGFHEYFSICP